MSIIQKFSTYRNYNRAMNVVKKTENYVLKNYGVDELLKSCDTVHIPTPSEKGILPSIKRFFLSLKDKMPSCTFKEEASIRKSQDNRFVEYLYENQSAFAPNKTFRVLLDQDTKKVHYSKESAGGVDRFVRFDRDGKVLQIYYEGYNAPNKSIFYGNGKREVGKYCIR